MKSKPGGGCISISGGRGDLDLTSSLEAIWAKVRPSSPNKRKNLGSSVTTRQKSTEEIPILGSYLKFRGQNLGCLSLIFLEAKFGAPTRISEANFGAKAPRSPDMKVPPLEVEVTDSPDSFLCSKTGSGL